MAHVFAFWRSERDYERFMGGVHDRLAAGQAGTYDSINVRLFDLVIGDGPTLGPVVRLAHCQVRAGRQDHFVQAQADVWDPGMRAVPGMRDVVFGRRGEAEFLVLSSWASATDHDRYRTDRFPELRRRSGAVDDLAGITGELVTFDPLWTVSP